MPWTLIPSCFRSTPGIIEGQITSRNLVVLPINTGIPLSVDDPNKLMSYVGAPARARQNYTGNRNLLYEHNQLGVNSSYEGEDEESIEECEEVEIARAEEEAVLEDTNRFDMSQFRPSLE